MLLTFPRGDVCACLMETSDVRTSLVGLVPLCAYRPIETGVSYPLSARLEPVKHIAYVIFIWQLVHGATVLLYPLHQDIKLKKGHGFGIQSQHLVTSYPIHAQVTHIDMSNQPQRPQDHRPRGCKISLARSARVLHAHEDPNRPLHRPHD